MTCFSTLALTACGSGESEPTPQPDDTAIAPASNQAASSPGKLLFLQCAACHALEADAPAKVGPPLICVIGKPAASYEGFNYSQAFKTAATEGLTWDRDTLLEFITNPKDVVPGNSMAFGGVSDPVRAGQIIDYIEQECGTDGG